MSNMTSSVGTAHRMPRAQAEPGSGAGSLAGLITLILVLVPVSVCGWYASTMLAGVPAVEAGPDGHTGAITWLFAALLLLSLPPVVGTLVGRYTTTRARRARR